MWFILFLVFLSFAAGRYIKFFQLKVESPFFYLIHKFVPILRSYGYSYFLVISLFALVVIFSIIYEKYLKLFRENSKNNYS